MKPMAEGRLVIAGDIETADEIGTAYHELALLIVFDSTDDIRQAISDGMCRFDFAPAQS